MAAFNDHIRNIALLGHAGSGKTALAETLLHASGAINQKGNVSRGNTVSDFTDQEKAAGHSLETSILQFDHFNTHVNLLDTPGYPDFFGRAMSILPAVESVALVINARNGIEPVTRRAFEQMHERKKCGLIIINQCDLPEIELESLLMDIQDQLGSQCLPINLPSEDGSRMVDCYFAPEYDTPTAFSSVTEAHDQLIDQVVEIDEALMELYLEQEESLQPDQLHDPFEQALREDHLIPVCFTSAETGAGIEHLLHTLCELMPTPSEGNPPLFLKGEGENAAPVSVVPDPELHTIAHVFKVSMDPYIGRMGVFRVHQGTIHSGDQLFLGDARKPVRIAHLLKLQGSKTTEVSEASPGDICAVAKIDSLYFNGVLHDSHDEDHHHLRDLQFPPSMASLAISPAHRGDEQKLSEVLHRLIAEDPSLTIEHRERENETVLLGLGETHLQLSIEKMAKVYGLEVATTVPSIPYRETIRDKAEGHHRHKKQNGGSGQFGEVFLRIEPLPRGSGFEFASEVVGGVIPSQYIPAVEKGVREVILSGAIAGYPMQDIRVVVYDGKHHSVDSKEIAFVAAGKKAFLDAIQKADPVVLEPFVEMDITVPNQAMGDVTGHLASERGMVTGTDAGRDMKVTVHAQAPLANVSGYSNTLKSMTGGDGEYSMQFSHYDCVPVPIQKALVKAWQA